MRIFIIFALALFLALPEVSMANTTESKNTVSQQIFGKKKHKGWEEETQRLSQEKGLYVGLIQEKRLRLP